MAKAPHLLYRVRELISHQSLLCLDSSIKEDTLLTGYEDGTVSEWNMNFLRKTDSFTIGDAACLGLKTLGTTLLTQDKLGHVKLWEPCKSNWAQIGAIQVDYSGFSKIDVTKNFGGLVACPTRHGIISVYSVKDCQKVMTLQKGTGNQLRGEIMALKFIDLAQDSFLLVAFENGDLELYDLKIKGPVSNVKLEDCILSLDFHTESMLGLCGSVSNHVQAFTVSDSMGLALTRHLDVLNGGVGVIKINPHKRIVVLGGWDGAIKVFSWRNLNALGILSENCSEIRDIDFSADVMVVVDSSGRIVFWTL